MYVIGTAGHVDHGKSTLVEALTGIHPDRLKEEKVREMTIDLGFAWLTLPNGVEVGIVDVPGHRDFIENMLAGVGGIDAVLFVVAADEGVMPQTREHLVILDILQIQRGVIALTKVDLIDDKEWLALVEEDIRRAFENTCLKNAPLVPVSAKTGRGIEELKQALSICLAQTPKKNDFGRPRLPIDRVFSLTGFGTVVTGTLLDGRLKTGDEIEILPAGIRGRIRGLQSHKRKETEAKPGSRTAVNLSGIDTAQIQRGDVLTLPGLYQPSQRVDASVKIAAHVETALKHNTEVKFFHGTSEVIGRVRLLGFEQLAANQEGWVQIEFRKPVVVANGDRFILRRPSPPETLGGGQIVNAHAPTRYKRFSTEVLERLKSLASSDPQRVLLEVIRRAKFVSDSDAFQTARLEWNDGKKILAGLFESGQVKIIGEEISPAGRILWLAANDALERERQKIIELVREYHQEFPLRKGIPREELRKRTGLLAKVFQFLYQNLLSEQILVEESLLVRLPGHQIQFNIQQQRLVNQLLERFFVSPFSPPSVRECVEVVGEDIFQALLTTGTLIQVSSDVVFLTDTYRQMVEEVIRLITLQGTLTVSQFRDRFSTSRKYALAFLEYLDQCRITRRNGDVRTLT